MPKITSLAGPAESVEGRLMLRIPLSAGGEGTKKVAVQCLQGNA
jgi:hypothetical protein